MKFTDITSKETLIKYLVGYMRRSQENFDYITQVVMLEGSIHDLKAFMKAHPKTTRLTKTVEKEFKSKLAIIAAYPDGSIELDKILKTNAPISKGYDKLIAEFLVKE